MKKAFSAFFVRVRSGMMMMMNFINHLTLVNTSKLLKQYYATKKEAEIVVSRVGEKRT